MKRVSKQVFDKFYEDNVTSTLNRTPRWNGMEQSITWKWKAGGNACMIVLVGDLAEYYLAK